MCCKLGPLATKLDTKAAELMIMLLKNQQKLEAFYFNYSPF